MNIKVTLKNKSLGEWLSGVAAVASLVVMLCYIVYTSGLGSLNTSVVLCMVVSVACNALYFLVQADFPVDILGILEIVAVACTAESFVLFLLASINNLADLINGIQIFSGATGSIEAIFGILIALLVIGVVEIVACFLKKSGNE